MGGPWFGRGHWGKTALPPRGGGTVCVFLYIPFSAADKRTLRAMHTHVCKYVWRWRWAPLAAPARSTCFLYIDTRTAAGCFHVASCQQTRPMSLHLPTSVPPPARLSSTSGRCRRRVVLWPHRYIRPEQRFPGLDALLRRIRTDVGIARTQLDDPHWAAFKQDACFAAPW